MKNTWINALEDAIKYGNPIRVFKNLMKEEENFKFTQIQKDAIKVNIEAQKRVRDLRKSADAEAERLALLAKVAA